MCRLALLVRHRPGEVTLGKNLVGGNTLLLLDTIVIIITIVVIIITIIITFTIITITTIVIIITTPGNDCGKEVSSGKDPAGASFENQTDSPCFTAKSPS